MFFDSILIIQTEYFLCFTFLCETLLYQKETILFFLHKFNDQLCQCIPTFSEYEILKQQIGQKNFAANFTKKNLVASQKIFFLPLFVAASFCLWRDCSSLQSYILHFLILPSWLLMAIFLNPTQTQISNASGHIHHHFEIIIQLLKCFFRNTL